MEVTHSIESDNHVIIGGGPSRAFSIATTAEFVSVLSDALYANKELAVMREVMCNAWDSHITSKVDKPITVTFTNTSVSIRDYGAGIADDHMEDVYCTYGESTKRHETATTGGFGLGSKSPFAISESFTVTSYHKGTKTVYAISKGSEDTDGLPELRTIVSVPTTETGLQVDIPISDMFNVLHEYAYKIAIYGEMKVDIIYNEDTLSIRESKIGLNTSEHGFVILHTPPKYVREQSSYVYVQYGSVIYPVYVQDAFKNEFSAIQEILDRSTNWLGTTTFPNGYVLIKAPDSSLSINPSRETLSYSKFTNTTLKTLLEGVYKHLSKVHSHYIIKSLNDMLDKNIKESGVTELDNIDDVLKLYNVYYDTSVDIKRSRRRSSMDVGFLNTTKNMHEYFLSQRYNLNRKHFSSFLLKAIRARAKQISKNASALRMFRALVNSKTSLNSLIHHQNPKLMLIKELLKTIFKLFGNNGLNKYLTLKRRDYNGITNVNTNKIFTRYTINENICPSIIIIGNNQTNIKKAADYFSRQRDDKNIFNEEMNPIFHSLVIPKNKEKTYNLQTIADKLELEGYTVVRAWDDVRFAASQTIKAPKKDANAPKRSIKGYALLSDCLHENGSFAWERNATANRIEDPELILNTETSYGIVRLRGFTGLSDAKYIAALFPKAVVVSNSTTWTKACNKHNLPHAHTILKNKLDQLSKQTAFIESIASQGASSGAGYYHVLSKIPEIVQEFGLDANTFTYNESYVWLYNIYSYQQANKDSIADNIIKVKDNILLNLTNYKLVTDRNYYLSLLDGRVIKQLSGDFNLSADKRKSYIALITAALKG